MYSSQREEGKVYISDSVLIHGPDSARLYCSTTTVAYGIATGDYKSSKWVTRSKATLPLSYLAAARRSHSYTSQTSIVSTLSPLVRLDISLMQPGLHAFTHYLTATP